MRSKPEGDQYRLGHRWLIEGPIDTVFHFVTDGNTVTEWWAQFRWAEMVPRTVQVGSRLRARVRSFLPYELFWEAVICSLEPPHLVEYETRLSLSRRFKLSGWIRYTLRERDGLVEVINEQLMSAERRLPWFLRAMAQLLFSWNHRYAMERGGRGLQTIVRRTVSRSREP
jgi:uncharacterized protein YndB with AHSA1/START domain